MPTRDEAIASLTASGPFELIEDHDAGFAMRRYARGPATLRALVDATRALGDRPFLIFDDQVTSYAAHHAQVAALARHLIEAGVAKGDRVGIGMRNLPEWSIAFFATQAIGAIAVALNAWWTGPELAYAIGDSDPAALIVDGERLARLRAAIEGRDLKSLLVVRREGAGPGGTDFETALAAAGGAAAGPLPDVEVAPGDLSTILYTSGTTGHPKGAMATHANHMVNLTNTMLQAAIGAVVAGAAPMAAAEAAANPSPAGAPQAGQLQTYPLFHIAGLNGLYGALARGSKLALMYKWDPPEAVRLIERHKLTTIAGVPIVVRQLIDTARDTGASLASVVSIGSGGAPVPPDLIRQIGDQFAGRAPPGSAYGSTETSCGVITNGGADYLARPGSVGRPHPTVEVRIADGDGGELPDGMIGEVWIRGPNVIPGYWRNKAATEATFGGGWCRTGDLGYRDAEGFYHVVDRLKDVIIRGGENVYCAEVESALIEQPGVIDAAVIGVPHAAYGEEVAAVVVVAPADLDADRDGAIAARLTGALAARLARFKIPTWIALTAAPLPRNATGKVLKRDLREGFFRT